MRNLAILLLLALACAHDSAPVTTIEFWGLGREGEVVAALIPQFERENPSIRVNVQQLPWTAAHEKLLTATSATRFRTSPRSAIPGFRSWSHSGRSSRWTSRVAGSKVVDATATTFPGSGRRTSCAGSCTASLVRRHARAFLSHRHGRSPAPHVE